MKFVKYFLLINIFIITITYSAFASLEINFQGHYGIAFPFNSIKVNDNYKNTIYDSVDGTLGFEGTLFFQIGNYFKLFEDDYTRIIKGVSLFGDIGFSINALMSDYKENNNKYTEVLGFYSMLVGATVKLNFSKMSIGLGTGIIAPLYAMVASSKYGGVMSAPDDLDNWNVNDMRNLFKAPIMPYIKLTIEGFLYLVPNFAVTLGGYTMYNFGMQYKTDVVNNNLGGNIYNQYNFSDFSIGLILGISFGRSDGYN
ncbi:hypothetical protein E6A47_10840 [Brachyspira pilosicoli]|uniref:hypothetical protein n=1 Tax=Brachyspira pilosicoli TaxID=52584 RepID=UPI000E11CB4B|nr:hypothetical protein [Brachyspira pilosicoli]MBW5400547.1 hypothetical protein [Brachyspira pilosicoli]SUW04782.1 serpentine_recp domain containing protein [Brachyspira pilosicoli]